MLSRPTLRSASSLQTSDHRLFPFPPQELNLPTHSSVIEDLVRLGMIPKAASQLDQKLVIFTRRVWNSIQENYNAGLTGLAADPEQPDSSNVEHYEEILRACLEKLAGKTIADGRKYLFESVKVKALQHSPIESGSELSTIEDAHNPNSKWTPKVTPILTSAFAVSKTPSTREKERLAKVTGLNKRQVSTWVRLFF